MSPSAPEPDAPIRPQTLEERVIWHCILWTYGYYVLGALYVLAPVIGWVLATHIARRDGLAGLPAATWAWIAGMLVMLLALIVAHADFQLGLGPMIKSSIGWAKGWALLAVFVVVGFGQIRLALLARAAALLGIQTLCLLPLVILAWAAHAPGHLYVSPISVVGGPGPEYFAVELYGISPDNGTPRWRLFAPWAPAIGMVMCVYFMLARAESNRLLRRLGMAGMLLAIVASSSRLGLLAIPATLGIVWLLLNMARPWVLMAASPIALLAGILAEPLIALQEEVMGRFHGARADSSRVRAALGRIAVERWQNEAVTWGHGAVERGPHIVEFMSIGTHHSWFGLLFVKGLVGVLALALPMLWSLVVLVRHAHRSETGRVALCMLVLLFLYTFAENLEILVYLFWPAMVVMGMAFREATFRRIAATWKPALAGEPA
jgi:hypothetical protein